MTQNTQGTERATLAAMMQNDRLRDQGLLTLQPDDFTSPLCREVFATLQTLQAEGKAGDLVTVGGRIQGDKLAELAILSNELYFSSNFADYVDELKRARKERYLRANIGEALGNLDTVLSTDKLRAICDKADSLSASTIPLAADHVDEALAEMGETTHGVSTGFRSLDRLTGGLRRGALCLIAARPSMGKSSLAMNIAKNVCADGGVVAVFSLEDTRNSFLQRMTLALSTEEERRSKDYSGALEQIRGYRLHVDDGGEHTAETIAAASYGVKQKYGWIDLVIVDYIGLLRFSKTKTSTRQQEIAEASHALKRLAKLLDCPVVVLSQLNRAVEGRERKEPQMSDLRESGDLEQDADMILFPLRPAAYDEEADPYEAYFIIAKNRNGSSGKRARVVWHGDRYLFSDMGVSS